VVRLRPAPHCRSKIISYSLKVEPAEGHFMNWQQDPFANYQARLVFPNKTREFKVTVDVVVEMAVYNPFDFFLEPEAEEFPFKYAPQLQEELLPYLMADERTEAINDYLATIDYTKRRTVSFLVDLNRWYTTRSSTPSAWSPACKRPKKRCVWAPAPAATLPG
jgi:transglutaminase-like putative cysteine protease